MPAEPTNYDLVTESDAGFARVQVKSTRTQDRRSHWVVGIHRQAYDGSVVHGANGARSRRSYAADEIDNFFIVTAAGDRYLIPLNVTGDRGSLTLDSKYAAFKVA